MFCHEDEVVDGKFLPKGTVVFVNVWGLHQDESKFANPDSFDPDHYKDRLLLAAEYANSADYENRDHYGYGSSLLSHKRPILLTGPRHGPAIMPGNTSS